MARSEPPAQLFQQCDNREFPHTYARAREGLRPKRPMRSLHRRLDRTAASGNRNDCVNGDPETPLRALTLKRSTNIRLGL